MSPAILPFVRIHFAPYSDGVSTFKLTSRAVLPFVVINFCIQLIATALLFFQDDNQFSSSYFKYQLFLGKVSRELKIRFFKAEA
jgi:hypothetical protein